MHRRPRVAPLLLAGALAACAGEWDAEEAPDADQPACSALLVALPETVDGHDRLPLGVSGAAAWGHDERVVVLRCGVEPPGPGADACLAVDGVDWVLVEGGEEPGPITAVTYGREPAVEVRVAASESPGANALVDLADAVSALPVSRTCLG